MIAIDDIPRKTVLALKPRKKAVKVKRRKGDRNPATIVIKRGDEEKTLRFRCRIEVIKARAKRNPFNRISLLVACCPTNADRRRRLNMIILEKYDSMVNLLGSKKGSLENRILNN
jgi:hypothetical protein